MTGLALPKVWLSKPAVAAAADHKGWSFKIAAVNAGIRADDLSRACNGLRPLPVIRAAQLAFVLGVPLESLLSRCPVCAHPAAVHDHEAA